MVEEALGAHPAGQVDAVVPRRRLDPGGQIASIEMRPIAVPLPREQLRGPVAVTAQVGSPEEVEGGRDVASLASRGGRGRPEAKVLSLRPVTRLDEQPVTKGLGIISVSDHLVATWSPHAARTLSATVPAHRGGLS